MQLELFKNPHLLEFAVVLDHSYCLGGLKEIHGVELFK